MMVQDSSMLEDQDELLFLNGEILLVCRLDCVPAIASFIFQQSRQQQCTAVLYNPQSVSYDSNDGAWGIYGGKRDRGRMHAILSSVPVLDAFSIFSRSVLILFFALVSVCMHS